MDVPELTAELLGASLGSRQTGGRPPQEREALAGRDIGHYRLQEALGSGGFGTVWAAEDLRLGRQVALKFLGGSGAVDETSRALLEAEARTVAALDHPGIVTLHALEEADGYLFLVMERVKGCTVQTALKGGPLPVSEVAILGARMAEAMDAAHRGGVVHRDLNPRNVMVTEGGGIKILDFGLALRFVAKLEGGERESHGSDGLRGTVPYMAPEQLEGCLVDARTDLWALGVMLFEMATGQRPFGGGSLRDLVEGILEAEPRWPANLPPAFRRVVAQCLEKDPARRFQHGHELARALGRLGQGGEEGRLLVLPFQDLGLDQDEEHLCEGLADDLLRLLGRVDGLQVVPRGLAFPLKGSALSPSLLCERMKAGNLLRGTLVRTAEGHQLELELLDGLTGMARWQQGFECPAGAWGSVQGEVVARVADALGMRPPEGCHGGPAVDPQAFEDALRGRQFYFRFHRHAMRFALEMYRAALDREPHYAVAWAGLANCAAWLYIYAERSEAHRDLAEAASARALALEPDMAEALAARGVALSAMGEAAGAEACFQRALAQDPGLYEAAYFLARHRFANGDMVGAQEAFDRAILLRPTDCQAVLLVAQVHESLGHPEAAEEDRWRGVRLAEARLRQVPDDVRTRYLAANALVALGQRDKGLAWARLARILDPDDPMLLYNLGCIHALAHNPDEALDCLEAAVRAGLTQRGWFQHDGDLASLRALPRFQALLADL